MGYYSNFTLRVVSDINYDLIGDESVIPKLQSYFAEKENEYIGGFINYYEENKTFVADEPMKWYNYHEDMLDLSIKFVDVLFELTGNGEESGDIWRCYYLNGKSQRCPGAITFDPFDASKLE